MKKILKVSNLILDSIGVLLAVLLVSVILLQVFMRYVISAPLNWSDEFARYTLVWITFFGSTLAMRDNEHLEVTVLTDILPIKVKTVVIVLGFAIVEFFLAVFFYYTLVLIKINGGLLSPAMQYRRRNYIQL